jgi:hypothetical protein
VVEASLAYVQGSLYTVSGRLFASQEEAVRALLPAALRAYLIDALLSIDDACSQVVQHAQGRRELMRAVEDNHHQHDQLLVASNGSLPYPACAAAAW